MPNGDVKLITELLSEIKNDGRDGESGLHDLLPLVYDELRRLANSYLRDERHNHTLQPTALVHEAYLRLAGQHRVEWQDRNHFFSAAARLMREILIDYARAGKSKKRGSGAPKTQIALDAAADFNSRQAIDVVALDAALSKLEHFDERLAHLVEMKFFGGLTIEEISAVLDISSATVKREWITAKMLLRRMLEAEIQIEPDRQRRDK